MHKKHFIYFTSLNGSSFRSRMKSLFLAFLVIFFHFREGITQKILEVEGVNYFFSYPKEANWFAAHYHCNKLGLDLIEIYSASQQEALTKVINANFRTSERNIPFWMGAIRSAEYPNFHWVNSGLLLDEGYTNWDKTNINAEFKKPDTNILCGYLKHRGLSYTWAMWSCLREFDYICGPAYNQIKKF